MTTVDYIATSSEDALTHSHVCMAVGGGDADDICICGAGVQIQRHRTALRESDAYLDALACRSINTQEAA